MDPMPPREPPPVVDHSTQPRPSGHKWAAVLGAGVCASIIAIGLTVLLCGIASARSISSQWDLDAQFLFVIGGGVMVVLGLLLTAVGLRWMVRAIRTLFRRRSPIMMFEIPGERPGDREVGS